MSNPQIHHQDDGSADITITLTPEQVAVWNDFDLFGLLDQFHTALVAVSWARMEDQGGTPRPKESWEGLLLHLERLTGRLDATKAAIIRRHRAAGGSLADLMTALDLPHSTAQDARTRAMDINRYAYSGWVVGEHDRGPDRK